MFMENIVGKTMRLCEAPRTLTKSVIFSWYFLKLFEQPRISLSPVLADLFISAISIYAEEIQSSVIF